MKSVRFNEADYQEVLREVACHRGFLQELQKRHAALALFPTWEDMVEFLQATRIADTASDAVLAALLWEYHLTNDSRISAALCAGFWGHLGIILRQRRAYEDCIQELWSNIMLSFYEAIQPKPRVSPVNVCRWILRQTENILLVKYYHMQKHDRHVKYTSVGSLVAKAGSYEMPDIEASPFDIFEWLDEQVQNGLISEEDRELLIQTRVEGVSLKSYAEARGIPYDTAAKHRSRLEESIRETVGPLATRVDSFHGEIVEREDSLGATAGCAMGSENN